MSFNGPTIGRENMSDRARIVALSVILWMVPLAAMAANEDACFDFVCDTDTEVCSFDALCSSADPWIWKYQWDFGDGEQTGLTGDSDPVHAYEPICYPAVTLTVHTFEGFDTVSCPIHTGANCPGPTSPTSGRCD
jgi:hypothetical protein